MVGDYGEWMGTLLSIFMVLMAGSASAATYSTKDNDKDGCPPSITHKADPDVEYKAGVGKDGWAVSSADAAPSPFPEGTFDEMPIGMNIPVGQYASGVSGVDLSETHIGVGQFSVKKDGELKFNGQPFKTQPYGAANDCE